MRSATPWLVALFVLFGCGLKGLVARADLARFNQRLKAGD